MKRIEELGNEPKEVVMKTLSWVLHAKRPLHAAELCHAVAVEDMFVGLEEDDLPDLNDIIDYCGSLVVHDSTEVIRFAHYTVQHFLENYRPTGLLAPTDLARVCLTYLSFNVFDTGPCLKKNLFNNREDTYKFAAYASQNWGTYTRGPGEEDLRVRRLLFRFLLSAQKA